MAKDVIITPLDGDIQFKNSSGNDSGKIEQSGDDLVLTNAVGDVLIGDGASDVFVGDGTNSVDIIFEQPGSIKGLDGSSVDLTVGSYDTDLTISGSTLNLQPGGNTTIIGGPLTVTKVSSDQNTSQDSGTIPATNIAETIKIHGGSYTNGQYTTEIVKVDRSGNLPLYVRQSKGTANAFTNLIRIGDHGQTNGTDIFAVFGKARVDGIFTVTGGSIVLGGTGRIQGIDTVSANTDAANKLYVDNAVTGLTEYVAVAGDTMTGTLTSTQNGGDASIYINSTRPTLGFTDSNSFTDANDIYIVRGTGGNKLQFQWYDDSAGTTTETFNIDSSGNAAFAGDLTVTGGDITLGGTGRIQGIDTVTAGTDAANKDYVDNHDPSTNKLPLAGGTMTGAIDFHQTDEEDLVISGNSSASNANQFFLKHNFAQVDIGNLRGDINFTSGSVQFTNDIHVGEYIYHKGDTNTFIRLLGDELRIVAGGRNIIKMDEGTNPDKVVLGDSTTETYTEGRVGIGTTPVSGYALAISGSMTFGVPAAGSVNHARYASIEGNADGSGEGSGRIFFTEHNSTTAAQNKYGMSLGYRGGLAAITTANGESWGGLSDIGNGSWGMWGHDNSLNGALIMYGDRAATYVDFAGNNIQGITDIYVADQILHTGDTDTYMQFHGNDLWRVVTGGGERIEANNTEVRIANNLVIGGTELDLPSGGMIDWANGDARIIEGDTNNYSLSFQTYDGSACNTALRLEGDNSALFNGPVTVDASGSTVLDIQGSQGQLFSITDDLSGDLFTVADISGVPILNVNASATSSFDGYLGIGTTTPTDKLEVYAPHSQFRLKDSDDNTFTQFSSSGGKLAIRQDSTSANHFWMDSNGKVGIGTGTFHGQLSVHGGHVRIDSSGGTDNYYLEFYEANNQRFRIYENSNNVYFDGGPGATTFRPRQGGGTNNFQVSGASMMLTTSGQVIGNTGEVLYLYAGGTSGAGLEINEPANSIYLKSIDGIYPDTDNTSEVGSSTYTFANGRFTNFHVDSTLTVRSYIDLADSDGIRFGSGDDFRMFYDGSNNELEMEMESACNRIRVTDNTTTRFSLEKGGTFQATAGFTTDGNAKSYTWRAIENTASTSNKYYRIARISGGQSTRFSIELVGRSDSYGDGVFTAWGKLVGQLNNDNNYDLTYYDFKTEDSQVVTEIAQIDVSTSATDIYIKIGQFSEIAAFGLISDGSITTYGNDSGTVGAPSGYTQAARFYTMHHNKIGNIDGTNFRDSDNTSYSLTPSSAATGYWQVNTPSGYVQIGPQNTSYAHFQTDRARFYFNKEVQVDGGVLRSHNEDLQLGRAGTDDKIQIRTTSIGFFLDGAEDMRLENDGDLHVERDVIAYSTTISDSRLKDNVITIGGALDKVKKLRGVEYTWNKGGRKDEKDIGVIAQEVEEVVPEIVREKKMSLMDDGDTKYKTVDYEKLTALLIEGMKEQQQQIDDLKAIVNKLQNEK